MNYRPKPIQVMAVDDDEFFLNLLEVNFESSPILIECRTFTEGSKLLTEMIKCVPDLLITDWQMPIMNGAEVLEQIFRTFDTSNLTILVVSSDEISNLRLSGLVPVGVEILHKNDPFERIKEIIHRISYGGNRI